jgi:hypothetical protein
MAMDRGLGDGICRLSPSSSVSLRRFITAELFVASAELPEDFVRES